MPFFADPANDSVMATFGEAVTWAPAGGSATSKRGIFDSRHYEVDQPDGSRISSEVTTLAVIATDWPSVATGDAVIARSAQWRVVDVRPDGQDMAVLQLEKDLGGT